MTISAPYNFVALSDFVVRPDWADQVSHDVPFSDGLSGTLTLRIEAHTPLFIRGSTGGDTPFQLPDGKYAIPGTSLRGMLRNVVEIASFGRMDRVTEARYGVRDLSNAGRTVYGAHLTKKLSHNSYEARSRAAWLVEDQDGGWRLQPVPYWRVEADLIEQFARTPNALRPRGKSMVERYKSVARVVDRDIGFIGDDKPLDHQHSNGVRLRYRKVSRLERDPTPGLRTGRIVLTGKPSPRKHMDFVFAVEGTGKSIAVPKPLREDFKFIHRKGQEKHGGDDDPNEEWKYWQQKLRAGERVPVFYLLDNARALRSFGLAMMFKLAYKNTPRDLARRQQAKLDPDERSPDLASLLFGHVTTHESDSSRETVALKGRVSVRNAVASGAPKPGAPVSGVLGSPKPSYYPSYVRQSPRDNPAFDRGKVSGPYKTYMDDDAKLRGWKRYPIRSAVGGLPAGGENVQTSFRPLPAGSTFESEVHLHNVRPAELGALLWALDFGARPECRHALGQARPFGFGTVSLSIDSAELKTADGVLASDDVLEAAREAYADYMNEQLDGLWSTSEQVVELVAMATPLAPGADGHLRLMEVKEHQTRKGRGDGGGDALPPPGDRAQLRAAQREQADDWHSLRQRYEAAAQDLRAAADAEAHTRAAKAEALRRANLPPAERARVELEEAQASQPKRHIDLLETWLAEAGEFEAARRQEARKLFPRKKIKMWKKDSRKAPVFRWLHPEGS